MSALAELAAQQIARISAAEQSNRDRFPAGRIVDVIRAGGMTASVFHATNQAGESIGTPVDAYVRKFGGTPCEIRMEGNWEDAA